MGHDHDENGFQRARKTRKLNSFHQRPYLNKFRVNQANRDGHFETFLTNLRTTKRAQKNDHV